MDHVYLMVIILMIMAIITYPRLCLWRAERRTRARYDCLLTRTGFQPQEETMMGVSALALEPGMERIALIEGDQAGIYRADEVLDLAMLTRKATRTRQHHHMMDITVRDRAQIRYRVHFRSEADALRWEGLLQMMLEMRQRRDLAAL